MKPDRLDFYSFKNGSKQASLRHLDAGPRAAVSRPEGEWLQLPSDFLAKLKQAAVLAGDRLSQLSLMQYVYLVDGHLYATDNECVVEIAVGTGLTGARFLADDMSALVGFGAPPTRALLSHKAVAFAWDDDTWCKFDRIGPDRDGNVVLASKIKALIHSHWASMPDAISASEKEFILDGKDATVRVGDASYRRSTLRKVLKLTTCVDFNTDPVAFGFPDGKGLMVQAAT